MMYLRAFNRQPTKDERKPVWRAVIAATVVFCVSLVLPWFIPEIRLSLLFSWLMLVPSVAATGYAVLLFIRALDIHIIRPIKK